MHKLNPEKKKNNTGRPTLMSVQSSTENLSFFLVYFRCRSRSPERSQAQKKTSCTWCMRVFFFILRYTVFSAGALMQSDKLLSGLIQATGRARQN